MVGSMFVIGMLDLLMMLAALLVSGIGMTLAARGLRMVVLISFLSGDLFVAASAMGIVMASFIAASGMLKD